MAWIRLLIAATIVVVVAYASTTATMSTTLATRMDDHTISHLRVSMAPILQAPSARPSVGQVELMNVHTSESVQIVSVTSNLEETRPLDNMQVPLPTPPQFHVSRLPDSLQLKPGQVAVVPVTFLPRFPSGTEYDRFEVRTSIEVHTDRGHVTLPIRATTLKRNDYDLPETITLQPPDSDDNNDSNHHYHGESSKRNRDLNSESPTTTADTSLTDCQQVQMRAPTDPITVTRVAAVKAPLISLSNNASKERKLLVSWAGSESDAPLVPDTTPNTSTKANESSPSLVIPVDGQLHTIATVCVHTQTIDDDPASKAIEEPWMFQGYFQSLGVLEILTAQETLFVMLEKTHDAPEVSYDGNAPTLNSDVTLKPIPDRLDINFLHNETTLVERTIRVYVPKGSPSTLRLMRASTILDTNKRDREYGLYVRVQPHTSVDGAPTNLYTSIEGLSLQDTVTLQISLDWDVLQAKFGYSRDSVTFHGQVELRATTGNDDFETWSRKVKEDPSIDANLTLTVPITTTIVRSAIGFEVHSSTHPLRYLVAMESWNDGDASISMFFFPKTVNDVLALAKHEESDERLKDYTYIDHKFHVFTNVLVGGVEMSQIDILVPDENEGSPMNSLCHRFEATVARKPGNYGDFERDDATELGVLNLRYSFESGYKPVKASRSLDFSSTFCQLRIMTKPDTGPHYLPLIIYPGQLDVTSNKYEPRGDAGEDAHSDEASRGRKDAWHRVVVGFDQMLDWFQSTQSGRALKEVLKSSTENKRAQNDDVMLGRYLYSLSRQSVDLENSKLRPVLLNVGAIQHDDIDMIPLYLTNHNPVPVTVAVDVGEVEGMTITLGRDESSGSGDGNLLSDYLPSKTQIQQRESSNEPVFDRSDYKGHPINGIRQFLLSERVFGAFFSHFPFRDAVTLSEMATSRLPLLNELYKTTASSRFHDRGIPDRLLDGVMSSCNSTKHPSMYGSFHLGEARGRRLPGPVIISGDGHSHRRLKVCWGRGEEEAAASNGEKVRIPPGGVVRVDVTLRSPPSDILTNDISQFLTTGLVLSTDHGEVLPILVSFEALQGALEVSYLSNSEERHAGIPPEVDDQHSNVVRVPPKLFSKSANQGSNKVRVPAHLKGDGATKHFNHSSGLDAVPLFMKSTFLRDVDVLEISSCNPWFSVALHEDCEVYEHPLLGVHVGDVSSTVACDEVPNDESSFPSFYSCATNWIENRDHLQSAGCGESIFADVDHESPAVLSSRSTEAGSQSLRDVVKLMKKLEGDDALPTTSTNATVKSGRHRSTGIASDTLVAAVSEAWRAWMYFLVHGMREISTTLRATIAYNSSELSELGKGERSRLAVTLRNLTVATTLEMPLLFDKESARDTTILGESTDFDTPSFIHFDGKQIGETASLYIPVRNPTSVPVRVRLSVPEVGNSGKPADQGKDVSASDDAIAQFLGGYPAPFVQPASPGPNFSWWENGGTYFLKNPSGEIVESQQQKSFKVQDIGSEVLLSNPAGSIRNSLYGCRLPCGVRDRSSHPSHTGRTSPVIGASAAIGESITNRARAYLVPDGQENNAEEMKHSSPAFAIPHAALDEIILPPFGTGRLGPLFFRPTIIPEKRKESRHFKSLVFLENSLTGLERVVLAGLALRESVVFRDVYSPDTEFGDIEMRHGRTALLFNDIGGKESSATPTRKYFLIENDGDTSISFDGISLSHSTESEQDDSSMKCRYGEFSLPDCETMSLPFTISPGESRAVAVEFRPLCRPLPTFVAVNLLSSQSGRREKLLVGYDIRRQGCIPYHQTPEKSIEERGYGPFAGILLSVVYFVTLATLVASFVSAGSKVFSRCGHAVRFYAKVNPVSQNQRSSNFGWYPTFRCLARSDPMYADLQALGREQSRHIVLARYRLSGILPPSCVSAAGFFQREPSETEKSRKQGNSERNRILSDAIFKCYSPTVYDHVTIPTGIKWQVVKAKGVSTQPFITEIRTASASESLFIKRSLASSEHASFFDASNSTTDSATGDHESESESESDELSTFSMSHANKSDGPSISAFSTHSESEIVSVEESVSCASEPDLLHSTPEQKPVGQSRNETQRCPEMETAPPRVLKAKPKPTSTKKSEPKPKPPLQNGSKKAPKRKEKRNRVVAPNPAKTKQEARGSSSTSRPVKPRPGLAPPPGFGSTVLPSSTLPLAAPNATSRIATEPQNYDYSKSPDRPASITRSQSEVSSISADAALQHQLGSSTLSLESPPLHATGESLEGLVPTGEFDIMDFLDGILNDGAPTSDENDEAAPPGILRDEMGSPQQQHNPSLPPLVSSNPWALDDGGRTSRAAAYGISFDESGDGSPTDGNLDVPLLTPAAILLAERETEEEDPGISLYANLLGE